MPALKNGRIPRVLPTEYASYRDIVLDQLSTRLLKAERLLSRPLVLYDPMAGTAPLIPLVECRGYTAQFNDLNSLHRYVNAAKLYKSYVALMGFGRSKLLKALCRMTSKLDHQPRTVTKEWFDSQVLESLTAAWNRCGRLNGSISTVAKAVLLLGIRDFSSCVQTKNRTWLKPGGVRPKVSTDEVFGRAIGQLERYYDKVYDQDTDVRGGQVVFTDFDALKRIPRRRVDVIMTSPPFCNRVDWDRLYGPEHFFLSTVGVWHARTEFLGTTAVRGYCDFASEVQFVTDRSKYLARFLDEVGKRQIHKEQKSNYYVKYFTRYFAGLFRAFDTAARALRCPNAGIFFVVQDNAHRGILIDIGEALAESLSFQGFRSRPIPGADWERHHLGLQNVSRRHRLVSPKQRERIWHAVHKS